MAEFMVTQPAYFVALCIIAMVIAAFTIDSCVTTLARHKTLRINGYPPPHCDVDGEGLESARHG